MLLRFESSDAEDREQGAFRPSARPNLWPSAAVPGLSLLFGPQTAEDCHEISADTVTSILRSLACLADYVVVDLPATLSPANRSVLSESDYLALVVEREPVCVEAAKFVLETIQKWDVTPAMSGTVIVNRAALVSLSPSEPIRPQEPVTKALFLTICR